MQGEHDRKEGGGQEGEKALLVLFGCGVIHSLSSSNPSLPAEQQHRGKRLKKTRRDDGGDAWRDCDPSRSPLLRAARSVTIFHRDIYRRQTDRAGNNSAHSLRHCEHFLCDIADKLPEKVRH